MAMILELKSDLVQAPGRNAVDRGDPHGGIPPGVVGRLGDCNQDSVEFSIVFVLRRPPQCSSTKMIPDASMPGCMSAESEFFWRFHIRSNVLEIEPNGAALVVYTRLGFNPVALKASLQNFGFGH